MNKAKYNSDLEYLKKYLKENNLDETNLIKYQKELLNNKPIQYIVGNVNFYGNIIEVNEDVLIPRYETEFLVEKTISLAKKYFPQKIDILDLGTGSGCIAITLKKHLESNIDALDISNKALSIARKNAQNNNVKINFLNKDIATYQEKQYDLIISNPPYISEEEEIMDLVKNNEPHIALYAKDNGLYFYKKIIDNLPLITKEKYLLALEIGYNQAIPITEYAKNKLKDINITVEKDLSNKDRYIFITNIKK
ncbi:MAG: peptide chain release factor N(5)-glutamine methyltransferase [Tenericutes bacterium]|nr:peptide chain release factor N(5)-glutamine methyltransferase [Mycoplasmatota bacterium]